MKYSFVNTQGIILESAVFEERPVNPHYSKGVWLPDIEPAYNPDIENLVQVSPITLTLDSIPYEVVSKDIDTLKQVRILALYMAYMSAQQAPITYMGSVFQADTDSQIVLAKTLAGMDLVAPTDFYWKDAANNKVPMDFDQVKGLAAAMFQQGWIAFKNLQNKKDQVESPDATIESINTITWE